MKISVIIPVYNVAPYLAKCLDSVINQTFTDLQIIVVDDGSTDEGGKICDEYAAKDKRIEVYHRKNEGLSAALNFGLSVVKGEYIAQVDSDDALHPKMYEILYNTMKQYDADMTCCKWSSDEKDVAEVDSAVFTVHQLNPRKDFKEFLSLTKVYRWNKLYKIELFKDCKYPEGHVYESFYIHRIAYYSSCAVMVDLPLYYYRMREGSFVHVFEHNAEQRVDDLFLAYEDRIKFTLEHNWTESYAGVIDEFCWRAMWISDKCKECKCPNRRLKRGIRCRLRKQFEKYPGVKVSAKYRLWVYCLPLYYSCVFVLKVINKIKHVIHALFRKK